MNPLAVKALAVAAALSVAFGAGWAVNGWRLGTELAESKAARSDELAADAKAALDHYKNAAETIHDAAAGAQLDLANVTAQLATIRKAQKNAPPPPLPTDCKPGAVRLRNLAETAAAADAAIARPATGR